MTNNHMSNLGVHIVFNVDSEMHRPPHTQSLISKVRKFVSNLNAKRHLWEYT